MMTGGSPDVLESDDVGLGIRLHLADLWDNRSAVIIGAAVALNPTVKTLLGYHRRDMGI